MNPVRVALSICILAIITIASASAVHAARGTHAPPKLLNLWFGWQLSEEDVQALAKWDLVVLDMDQQARFPERIRRLRELNPNIKILAYVDSSNIAEGRRQNPLTYPGAKLAQRIPEEWYMHRADSGARASMWPGAWMLNVTDRGPKDAQGRRWNDYLPEFIATEMWPTGLWDGIFLDNALDNATWFGGKGLDMTGDGKADPDAQVDAAWKAGWQKMARDLRQRLGANALIMGNGSEQHAGVTNGILFENFPKYGWTTGLRAYFTALRNNQRPSIAAINGNTYNSGDGTQYQAMRLAFASALMGDGYYAFDFGDQNHGQTWWYDEYDATLGAPVHAAERVFPLPVTQEVSNGVWMREYTGGLAIANSLPTAATVPLPGVYERLRGAQDSRVNNGNLETAVTLPAQDGLVLLRRLGESSLPAGTAFKNGDFVRVYHMDGSQPRAGFFAQHTAAPGGATVVTYDVDRDGRPETLIGANGEIRLTYGNGRSALLRPFGAGYRGTLTLAVGNVDRDEPWEIATGNETGEVRVLELNGTVRAAWRPYDTFRGSISVAIGDVDGDGLREIATGAGPGGGPHVRIFKTDGLPWRGGWFAFDSRERGGVFVAIADLDKDGAAELVTGSGEQTIPRIRIWRSKDAFIMREFTLGTAASGPGIRPSITDLEGDGTLEIIAAGIQVVP